MSTTVTFAGNLADAPEQRHARKTKGFVGDRAPLGGGL
jgi:hypothetical protein